MVCFDKSDKFARQNPDESYDVNKYNIYYLKLQSVEV